jgi:HSP20 family protein
MGLLHWEALRGLNTLYQQMYDLLHDLVQVSDKSTLWVADSGTTQISAVQVQETDAKLLLQIELPIGSADNLEIEVTEETVLIRGEQIKPVELRDYFDLEFYTGRFQSLIPLPVLVQPDAVLTELEGNVLTVTLQKSWRSRRAAKVRVGANQSAATQTFDQFVRELSQG